MNIYYLTYPNLNYYFFFWGGGGGGGARVSDFFY